MKKNKILALKYRPQQFEDLIGQNLMAQTITNAIKIGKTPNAYLLTGIRGVGKTTSARLIAKALNCQKNINSEIKCSKDSFCETCKDIINSNHIDILEMDAASKTGIDDVRELIENSKYSPTNAKFKIFIIDEVHMLSKQAFNGLLKTLEEPPSSLKFILATTEVRKIPVTILSRCQRFDLKRVDIDLLCKHLKKISEMEKGNISDNALKLIAKSSEGSVRDAISLLDQALVTQTIKDKNIVEEIDVRNMLGLGDRDRMINLVKEALSGNSDKALKYLKEMLQNGLDAKNFLNDVLEILYLFSRRINLGVIENDMTISESEAQMIDNYSKGLHMQDIGLFWQLTVKTIDDLRLVGNENLTLEMYIMQLVHLVNIESEEKIKKDSNNESSLNQNLVGKKLKDNISETDIPNQVKNQLKNTDQIKTLPTKKILKVENDKKIEINSFQDLIDIANNEKEIELKFDLERNVKLVTFNKGKINMSFNEKLNKNFIKNLTEKLLMWTGDRWIISLSKNETAKSIYEKNIENKSMIIEKFKNSDLAKKVKDTFSDAVLVDITKDNNE